MVAPKGKDAGETEHYAPASLPQPSQSPERLPRRGFFGSRAFSSNGSTFPESKHFLCTGHLRSAPHIQSPPFFALLAHVDGIAGPPGCAWPMELTAGEREKEQNEAEMFIPLAPSVQGCASRLSPWMEGGTSCQSPFHRALGSRNSFLPCPSHPHSAAPSSSPAVSL